MALENPFKPAPAIRPMLNIGCLFDIPTGRYHTGKHGGSILNGGLAYMTGIAGRGNTFKSAIAFRMMMTALDRYQPSDGLVYDTEMSATLSRIQEICVDLPRLGGVDLQDSQRVILTDKVQYSGTEWFDMLKAHLKARVEQAKSLVVTTPFIDKEGRNIATMAPYLPVVDSVSMFSADVVVNLQNKGGVGESERNVEAMRDAASKTQMLMEMPTITARSATYIIMTAHAGDTIQIDPYKPNPKKLAFLKGDLKLKNVPEKFTFLVNNCWLCTGSTVMINQTTKAPEFPRSSDDDLKGDTDLMAVTILNLRGKSGPTGLPFEIVVSQSEGVLVGMTEFLHIKQMDRYGIGGNDRNYFLELCPDINLSRTTVRGKIKENVKLRRALEITSEMCQIENLWHDVPEHLTCTPKQLYEELKAKGYDWDILLNTRGYWVFEEDNHPLNFLSTMDLLKMRVGEYVPYWYEKGKIK